ncbi:unnamed protein product [Camellia sinensis]
MAIDNMNTSLPPMTVSGSSWILAFFFLFLIAIPNAQSSAIHHRLSPPNNHHCCPRFQQLQSKHWSPPPSPSPSPPPPLPPLLAEKSGARFGIEKRVIPSGPNPLHN